MLFQSQGFIVLFLPAVLATYYLVAARPLLRQSTLLVASLIFYGWWDWRFLPLFLAHCFVAGAGPQLARKLGRRWPIDVAIALQLLSLGFWKYTDFLISSAGSLLQLPVPRYNIVLPIGISFFTFQLVSYLVDVRRGHAKPLRQWDILLYIGFFPHLIAGPIVRHDELLPQFTLDPKRPGLSERFGKGFVLFVLGAWKKIALADPLAGIADPIFAAAGPQTALMDAWTGALAFTVQLFFDFSAYSEMAIGLALMFGVDLPENFRTPYRAADLRDFWRRWHITLSSFFRDYVYVPLGGSRAGTARFVGATMITMGLCGLWHGAGWNYVVWGLLHGSGLIVVRAWKTIGRPMPRAVAWTITLLFVIVGWVVFRSTDLTAAGHVVAAMIGSNGFGGSLHGLDLIGVGFLISMLCPASHDLAARWIRPWPLLGAGVAAAAAALVIQTGDSVPKPFIYFQF